MSSEDQAKSEEATPFKLAKSREKGSVARGTDLGFFSVLGAFLLFLAAAGGALAAKIVAMFRSNLGNLSDLTDPATALQMIGQDVSVVMSILVLLGLTLLVVVVPIEIFQLKGLVLSAEALKPDFGRLNPAKGLKRLFSLRTLKEALKSVFKFSAYTVLTLFALKYAISKSSLDFAGARPFVMVLWLASLRLLALFTAAALGLAVLDQILARREFAKQMRMSRSEVTREHKEREGEPRIKAKRKQLHAEFLKQTEGIGKLAGSDMLIVNPEHFAVALTYRPEDMLAPKVAAKARNQLALAMRSEAARLGIPVIVDPPLARALFKSTRAGSEIAADHYRDVARHYSERRSSRPAEGA